MAWGDVGEHVRRARAIRRQTQTEFAREIGVSVRLLGSLEAGEARQYDPVTVHRVESALGWADGSVQRVVEGGQPDERVDVLLARICDAWPRLSPDARAILSELAGVALNARL